MGDWEEHRGAKIDSHCERKPNNKNNLQKSQEYGAIVIDEKTASQGEDEATTSKEKKERKMMMSFWKMKTKKVNKGGKASGPNRKLDAKALEIVDEIVADGVEDGEAG